MLTYLIALVVAALAHRIAKEYNDGFLHSSALVLYGVLLAKAAYEILTFLHP